MASEMICKSREEYIELCQQNFAKFCKDHDNHVLVSYVRADINKQPIGAVISFRDPKTKEIQFGWSLCHIGKDKYNKYIGLWQAIQRATKLEDIIDRGGCPVTQEVSWPLFDHKIQPFLEPLATRAKKYFKKSA